MLEIILAVLTVLNGPPGGDRWAGPAAIDPGAIEAGTRDPAAGMHGVRRNLKGDLRSRPLSSDTPAEIASIEIWGEPSRIVLRGYAGDVVFRLDPAAATTAVDKGVSIPQLMLAPPSADRSVALARRSPWRMAVW